MQGTSGNVGTALAPPARVSLGLVWHGGKGHPAALDETCPALASNTSGAPRAYSVAAGVARSAAQRAPAHPTPHRAAGPWGGGLRWSRAIPPADAVRACPAQVCTTPCLLHILGKMPALATGSEIASLCQLLAAAGTAGSRIPARGPPLLMLFPACARWRGWATALAESAACT